MTVYSGGKIFIYAATFAGNYGMTGSISINSGSTVEYASASTSQTISNYTYSTLILSGNSTKTIGSNLNSLASGSTLYGNIYINAGILDLSTFTANRSTSTIGGTFSIADGAKLRIGGTNSFPANYLTHIIGITLQLNTMVTIKMYLPKAMTIYCYQAHQEQLQKHCLMLH